MKEREAHKSLKISLTVTWVQGKSLSFTLPPTVQPQNHPSHEYNHTTKSTLCPTNRAPRSITKPTAPSTKPFVWSSEPFLPSAETLRLSIWPVQPTRNYTNTSPHLNRQLCPFITTNFCLEMHGSNFFGPNINTNIRNLESANANTNTSIDSTFSNHSHEKKTTNYTAKTEI